MHAIREHLAMTQYSNVQAITQDLGGHLRLVHCWLTVEAYRACDAGVSPGGKGSIVDGEQFCQDESSACWQGLL